MDRLRVHFAVLLACSVVCTSAIAQESGSQASVTISHTPPPPTLMESIDSTFKQAVEILESVLFYRLFTTERQYVIYERSLTYTREAGAATSPFVVTDPSDADADTELTVEEIDLLAAKGLLTPGDVIEGEQQNYRLGRDSTGSSLEYVAVKIPHPTLGIRHGTKYARRPGSDRWHRITSQRNLPSDTDVLTQADVEELAKRGWLVRSSSTAQETPPYVLTERTGGIPVVVAWLACGAVYFTIYMGFFNLWGFRHAVDVVRGKYDDPNDAGEVTHFQALASALSATVGLGNIAGVTIAMTLGGPGAFFWMLLCGLFGMTSKFVECTLGQKYRHVKPDGTVLGGPMRYLYVGLKEMKLGLIGGFLSVLFAIMCILASFGGGNMIQANQSGAAVLQMFLGEDLQRISEINHEITAAAEANDTVLMQELQQQKRTLTDRVSASERIIKPIFGIALAAGVALVILGGIKRIGRAAEKVVPTMCIIYVAACLFIIFSHLDRVPELAASIFSEAFTGAAMGGGILGVLVVGVQRAAFSNEAGAGSAAIAHSAARTDEPVREGCVALLGPFIDTIVVCSMTALVILITGAWDNSEWVVDQGLAGAALTSKAFESEISWFPYVLSVAVVLFAYSTIISWSYYGEKAWESLFGARSTAVYKVLAVTCVFIGTIVNLGSVLDFSDMMILGMAFPNIAGVVLLAPKVKRDLADYWSRYKKGEFRTFR